MTDQIELGDVFFTEYDAKITGSSQRDPLGLQPIWSHYGRTLIKHLTTISNDLRGFREVVLCLSICNECYRHPNSKRKLTLNELILLFEQLFVYSTIKHDKSDGIIGSDNGLRRYIANGDKTFVSFDDTILVSEISLGYYGRYKSPLYSMGIIDSYSRICSKVDVRKLFGDELYQHIFEDFRKILAGITNKQTGFRLNEYGSSDRIYEAICGELREGEEKFWLNRFQIDGTNQDELMTSCYRVVNQVEGSQENIGQKAIGELPKTVEVKDVERVELFLRCLEYVFYESLQVRNVGNVAINETIRQIHSKRYDDFCKIKMPKEQNTILNRRLNYIKTHCNPRSTDYVKNIINYHSEVCKQKHSSVWVEYNANGDLQVFVQPDTSIDIDKWGRDYYFAALWGIKSKLGELSNATT